ncbi:hypothetical protein LCGC14_2712420, partial [marine sediment metagenome]
VRDTVSGRFLGAFGTNFWRSWVCPLYTPSGLTVVREFPFDHPFHNGVFVGQNPVTVGGRTGNFWAFPVKRSHDDHIMARIGRMDPQGTPEVSMVDDGIQMTLASTWRDENEEPLIDELRVVTFRATADATICDMASVKTAAYGAAEFAAGKFGSIGARVEPRLLPELGGQVIGGLDVLEGVVFEPGVVRLEGVDAGEMSGVFLVGPGGIQRRSELGHLFLPRSEVEFAGRGPLLAICPLIVQRLRVGLQLPDPLLLGGNCGALGNQAPACVGDLMLDRLKCEKGLQDFRHSMLLFTCQP